MKKKRFTEEQIVNILKEHESGLSIAEVCRKYGCGQSTVFKWKNKYGGMDVPEVKRLKSLEEENRRLKQMYADLSLEHRILKDFAEKKF
jgi:putative transposase